jgi:hypothetical protein
MIRSKTIICDIDGTLVKHASPVVAATMTHKMELLPGTLEKILEWELLGCKIILLTGRRESLRKVTESQLSEVGIIYDQLVMGVLGGQRILINDKKTDGVTKTAFAINLKRNSGISNISLNELD